MKSIKLSVLMLITSFVFTSMHGVSVAEFKTRAGLSATDSDMNLCYRIDEFKTFEDFIIKLRKFFGTAELDAIWKSIQENKSAQKMTPDQQQLILVVARLLNTRDPKQVEAIIQELQRSQKDIQNNTRTTTNLENKLDELRGKISKLEDEKRNLEWDKRNINDENIRLKRNTATQAEVNSAKAETQNLKDYMRDVAEKMKNRANR